LLNNERGHVIQISECHPMSKKRLRSKDERPHRHVGPAPSAPAALTCEAYTSQECLKVPDSSSSSRAKKSHNECSSPLSPFFRSSTEEEGRSCHMPSHLLVCSCPPLRPACTFSSGVSILSSSPRVTILIHGSGVPEPHPPLVRRLQPLCLPPDSAPPRLRLALPLSFPGSLTAPPIPLLHSRIWCRLRALMVISVGSACSLCLCPSPPLYPPAFLSLWYKP
jgi:hypothetical protein